MLRSLVDRDTELVWLREPARKIYPPIHPGEVLMEDFLEGFGVTQNKLAVSIGVPPRRINEIVHGKRGITADTALRLGRYFGVSPQSWLNLQTQYELKLAEDRVSDQITAITPWAMSSR